MIARVALVLICLSGAAIAQSPSEAARAASSQLAAAGMSLTQADSARDRVAALTATVQAYEEGLSALRDGLRRAAIRQRTLERDLEARSDEVARLLGVLQTMGRTPTPLLLLHPSGPTGTARSGMMLADVTPALQAEVGELRVQLDELATLRALQTDALATLEEGLSGAQQARAALSHAISERTDLPRRFSEDPVRTALLLASTETLEAFASGLAEAQLAPDALPAPDATALMGQLVLPVDGEVLRRFEEADAAGITRPGILISTRPRALLTAPTAVTLRYSGPLLDYGTVLILEPAPDVMWVLAGLAEAYGEEGEVLAGGAPLGLMGGETPPAQEILTESQLSGAGNRTQTLYLEVRDRQGAINPDIWFAFE